MQLIGNETHCWRNKRPSPAPNVRHWLNQCLRVVLDEMFDKQSNVLIASQSHNVFFLEKSIFE